MAATNETKILVSLNDYKIHDKEALHGASVSGKTLTITKGDGTTVSFDASYSNATTSAAGLMSAADKAALEGLTTTGGQPNVIETVKVKTSSTNTTTLTPDSNKAVTVDVSGKADKATTLSGYGITDAKIAGGVITLGSNTITPVTDVSDKAPLASPALTGTPTAPTAAADTNTTQIATTAFVQTVVGNVLSANDAMIFKGVINSSAGLPAKHEVGWTYKVGTAGSYLGHSLEVGDVIICVADGSTASNDDWTIVQNNIDGAVTGPASATNNAIATFDGTTGKVIKNSSKTISTTLNAASDAQVPTSKAVATYIANQNFITDISGKQDVIGDLDTIRTNAEAGAGLVTKVGGIEEGAQVNKIESVKVKNAGDTSASALTITSKSVTVDLSGYVPNTRKVNNKALSADITLAGSDIALAGYSKPSSTSAVAATDTVNAAIGKLEKALDGKAATSAIVTYSDFTGATASAAGTHGLVPAPAAGAQNKILSGDAKWKSLVLTVDENGNGTLGFQE